MKKMTILVSSLVKNAELGDAIKEAADKKNFKAHVVNLVDLALPLYSTAEEKKAVPPQAVELKTTLQQSDALVVVAPEYNGSIPPVLNNAIAWVSRAGEDWREAFNGKPTLIATHSGGGGMYVLMAMRQQLSYIGANVIGRQLVTNFSKPLNPESLESCLDQL